jgi:hypothetical protein
MSQPPNKNGPGKVPEPLKEAQMAREVEPEQRAS